MTFDITRALVADILANPHHRDWTLQGFGMLRTYLPDDVRLHVWDSRYAVKDVSLIHDHPWDFESLIVAGALRNVLYARSATILGDRYMMRTIKPGVGLKMLEQDQPVHLQRRNIPSYYQASQVYKQRAEEIHASYPEDGTVTIVKRTRREPDVALVFYPQGGEWVSAEPRDATTDEIEEITSNALRLWFNQGDKA